MSKGNQSQEPLAESVSSPRPALQQFFIGDTVWIVKSGTQQVYVECPDCFGQCALTVTLGDGSQVSIDCDCCKNGWMGPRGSVLTYEWHCEVTTMVVHNIEIRDGKARYNYNESVFATKEEAEAASAAILAAHVEEEAHRFSHVKDRQVRHRTWAFSVSYHRNRAKAAKKDTEYHESKLAVAKAKATSEQKGTSPTR